MKDELLICRRVYHYRSCRVGMERRNISPELVREVLEKPEQRLVVREGREVFQSRKWIKGKRYLIRIFVEVDRSPAEVVTAYRTSRITKYWREVG